MFSKWFFVSFKRSPFFAEFFNRLCFFFKSTTQQRFAKRRVGVSHRSACRPTTKAVCARSLTTFVRTRPCANTSCDIGFERANDRVRSSVWRIFLRLEFPGLPIPIQNTHKITTSAAYNFVSAEFLIGTPLRRSSDILSLFSLNTNLRICVCVQRSRLFFFKLFRHWISK